MPKPSIRTIQRLYAMSGNRCAFSGCPAPIIEDSPGMAGINMGEICHIRASKAGGERYDPEQSDDERHGYENLILLCRRLRISRNLGSDFARSRARVSRHRGQPFHALGQAGQRVLLSQG